MIFAILAWVDNFSQKDKPLNTQEEINQLQAAKNDPADFEPLYQRYVEPLYRYLRLHTGSEEDAADLTQQVFLQAMLSLPSYRERGVPFGAWLFRIARNLAINSTRRRRATVAWELLPPALEPAADRDDPEAEALKHENLTRLHQLLSKLDNQKKEILALHFGADLTLKEIATVLGKSEAAVKKQLSRTVNNLKDQYGEQV